jgi:hypothetical protein
MGDRIFAVVNGLKPEKKPKGVDISAMENSADVFVREQADKAKALDKAIKSCMSPKGTLGLSKAMEEARWRYGMIDAVFGVEAYFNRVCIWQLPDKEVKLGSGILAAPEMAAKRMKQQTPSGIIVAAGLEARDMLRGQGHKDGDIVLFIRLSPWRIETGHVNGNFEFGNLIVLTVGDVVGNLTQRERMTGKKPQQSVELLNGQHLLKDGGKLMTRGTPYVEEDYE